MNKTLQILEQALTERAKWRERGVRLQRPTETVAEYIGQDFHYLSFTALKKLGLNPSTQWATPLGIYAYPLGDEWFKGAWAKSLAGANGEKGGIPFATEQPYIQLFRAKASRRVVVIGRSGNAIENDVLVDKAMRELYRTMPFAVDRALELINMRGWNMQGDMRKLWLVTMFIAMEEVGERGKMVRALKSDNQHIVRWSKLLLDLGIDGVEDRGSGVIHPNEPHQAVFFRLSDVQQIDMITNPLLRLKSVDMSPTATPASFGELVTKLGLTVTKFMDDMGIDDLPSRTLEGRIGDMDTGKLFTAGEIIEQAAGDFTTLSETLLSWYDQIIEIRKTLYDDAFLQECLLGLGGATSVTSKKHNTKLKLFGQKLKLIAGQTIVDGVSTLPISKNNTKDVVVFTSKSSTKMIDCVVEPIAMKTIKTNYEGDYNMALENCFVMFGKKDFSDKDIAAIITNKSETIRRVLERNFSVKLGLNILLAGEFEYVEGSNVAQDGANSVMMYEG